MDNYKILKNNNETNLEEQVNRYLLNGYSLNGGLIIIYCPIKNKSTFYQSMKKDLKTVYHWSDWE